MEKAVVSNFIFTPGGGASLQQLRSKVRTAVGGFARMRRLAMRDEPGREAEVARVAAKFHMVPSELERLFPALRRLT